MDFCSFFLMLNKFLHSKKLLFRHKDKELSCAIPNNLITT